MTNRLAGRECPALGSWEAGETLAGKELLQGHAQQGQTISPVARGASSWVSGSGWVVTGLAVVTCWPLVSSCLHEGSDLLVFSDLLSLGAQHGHQGHLRRPAHAGAAPSLAQQRGASTLHGPDLQAPRLSQTQEKAFPTQFTRICPRAKHSSLGAGGFKLYHLVLCSPKPSYTECPAWVLREYNPVL